MVGDMKRRLVSLVCGVLVFLEAPALLLGEPVPAASAAFERYCKGVEARLAAEHRAGSSGFLVGDGDRAMEARLRGGEVVVEKLSPADENEFAGAMLHDWRGSAFAQGAKAEDFERVMRDFGGYPRTFAPEVLQARVVSAQGDHLQVWMRVRQKHGITVVMDSTYDVGFGRLDARHGWSVSRSLSVLELEGAGTRSERVLSAGEEHGFLWRMNTYWSFEEKDGGLYVQVESVSLTRAIPRGLGWAVGPFVESIPRESMEFTLRSAVKAMSQKEAVR